MAPRKHRSPLPPQFFLVAGPLLVLAHCATDPNRQSRSSPEIAVSLPPNGWTEQKKASHAVSRLAFGSSPDDQREIAALGVEGWIDRQLHPRQISDELLADKLRAFPILTRSPEELEDEFPLPQARAKMLGLDPGSPEARTLIEAIPKEELPQQIDVQMLGAKMVRAVESRRQLEEVLTDFWFNHFNVSIDKGPVRWMATSYERDAIRPHVFGYFRELLAATAHHPAMLFYLDNWLSVRDRTPIELRRLQDDPKRNGAPPPGLNENYARELLELHTLGVNGGYMQKDVRETARAFTGWTIDEPNRKATFLYRDEAHDKEAKTVLGMAIARGGGISDGEKVLELLSNHPSTARFIATKLCRKFVSDNPPAELVERILRVFLKTGGYLPSVYAAIFSSPEFWSDQAFAAKTKTPLEFAVSAVRALGGVTSGDAALGYQLERLGEPLYRSQPPTGYPDTADSWVNAGALVNRLNFGLALAGNRIHGTTVDLRGHLKRRRPKLDLDDATDALAALILQHPLTPQTCRTVQAALGAVEGERPQDGERRPIDVPVLAGLLLGSPEFQKR